jgi:Ca2+-transporting ATPase
MLAATVAEIHLLMEMKFIHEDLSGLTTEQVLTSRASHGANQVDQSRRNSFFAALKDAAQEPMLILLAVASVLYFLHGDTAEAVFLLISIVLVYSISRFQKSRSENALDALKKLTQPKCKVIRDGVVVEILREEVVIGDLLMVEEGSVVAADATIIQANDFTVNESILTGESMPVDKNEAAGPNSIYQGTSVVSGLAIAKVTAVGKYTKVGMIGKRIEEIEKGATPLQRQITSFVNRMATLGIMVFVVIWGINIYKTRLVIESLLNSLTLAMSILPEEIPVAFATFMALGAWRMMKLGVIVKDIKTVEALGSATIICVDKTGTITKNIMSLDRVYVHATRKVYGRHELKDIADVVTAGMWASEPIPFDPMEKELHRIYSDLCEKDLRPFYKMMKEYPLAGKPPLMTHVFRNESGHTLVAAKGAPEAILAQSDLSDEEKDAVNREMLALSSKGYRVLGVGRANNMEIFPDKQSDFVFTFLGLVAFFDPPKENIKDVLSKFYDAGIRVKIITGDNLNTTCTIAEQIGFRGTEKNITGDKLMDLNEADLDRTVREVDIFARMFPEAKLRVIEALRRRLEIVAMTGDGVNDGPALKAADIGVAMGRKGSEIAKQASALILVEDDLARMVDAVAMGRKIYTNLKKAIQYIISIHIPIILIVFLPLLFGWLYPAVFTPVHVIFLELVMGPTCSVIYENEPIEENTMKQPPRKFTTTFFNFRELSTSIIQGLVITSGLLSVYWYSVAHEFSLPTTSAAVFITLIAANTTLTLVNRSFHYSIVTTLLYHNYLIPLIILATVLIVVMIFLMPPLRSFFAFAIPPIDALIVAIGSGFISSIWFELFKAYKRVRSAAH